MDDQNSTCKKCGNDTFTRQSTRTIISGVRVLEGADWPGSHIKHQYFCAKCGEELKPEYDEWGNAHTP